MFKTQSETTEQHITLKKKKKTLAFTVLYKWIEHMTTRRKGLPKKTLVWSVTTSATVQNITRVATGTIKM